MFSIKISQTQEENDEGINFKILHTVLKIGLVGCGTLIVSPPTAPEPRVCVCTLHSAHCTLHFALCILQIAICILHSANFTLQI